MHRLRILLSGFAILAAMTTHAHPAGLPQAESQNADTLAASGRQALADKEYGVAVEQLARASELRPDDPMLMADLGIAYARTGEYSRGHNLLMRIMGMLAECPDPCSERRTLEEAMTRLEGRLGVP